MQTPVHELPYHRHGRDMAHHSGNLYGADIPLDILPVQPCLAGAVGTCRPETYHHGMFSGEKHFPEGFRIYGIIFGYKTVPKSEKCDGTVHGSGIYVDVAQLFRNSFGECALAGGRVTVDGYDYR